MMLRERRTNKYKKILQPTRDNLKIVSASLCLLFFILLFAWCLPVKDIKMCCKEKSEVTDSTKILEIIQGYERCGEEVSDSVAIYSSKLEQIEGQYKIYEVIYFATNESDSKYVLCKILINKDKKYGNEICPVIVSGRLMDLLGRKAETKNDDSNIITD